MKKKTILLFAVLLLICGCNKKEDNKLTCTYKNTLEGNLYTTNVNIDIEKDSVKSATAIITYEDETLANSMCDIYKVAEDGSNVTCDGKSITIKDFHKSVTKSLEKDVLSKDDIAKYFEDNNYTCE